MSITQESLFDSLSSYMKLLNDTPKIKQVLKTWSPIIHFSAKDNNSKLPLIFEQGTAISCSSVHEKKPDLAIIGTSNDFHDLFHGKLNPTEKYMNGDITVKGSQMDIIKLDAISMVLWPE